MKVIVNKIPLKYFKGEIDKATAEFIKVLYIFAGLSIIYNSMQDIVYGIKGVLIYCVSILICRETEIFFISHKSDVSRSEAKEALQTTKPEVTALIYALLLPVGTPLFIVSIGAFISIFVGKMIFGGYSFNVFNPAIVGRLFVVISWPALVTFSFPNILDNYLLGLIFNKDLSTELLSPLMELQANGIVSLENMVSLKSILFLPNVGMFFAVPAIFYIVAIVYFGIRKTVDLKPLIFTVLFSIIILYTIGSSFDLGINYILFHLLTGGLLFVTLFMMTDPFTKPFNTTGVMIYSFIFTFAYILIRFLGKDSDGVLNALLFANIFVPLLNKKSIKVDFGFNKKSIITVIVLISVLIGTGLFTNTILKQRIENKEIVVNAYVKS